MKWNQFFLRFRNYLIGAYSCIGILLVWCWLTNSLSQILLTGLTAIYIVGVFLLRSAVGYSPPFNYVSATSSGKVDAAKDFLKFIACVTGAFGVGVVGALINPTSTLGIILIIGVPGALFIVLGGISISRVLMKFLKFK